MGKKPEMNTNKKQSSGENTGRWTSEEHGAFLEGLKIHGKEWKKIANLIETRTVVQIRTHAQKYFQKLAKTREQKGEEIPQDLVSTASNPRNVPDRKRNANAARRRANSQQGKSHGGVGSSGSSPSTKGGVGAPLGIKIKQSLATSLRSDTPLPTDVLGDVEAHFHSSASIDSGRSGSETDSDDTLSALSGFKSPSHLLYQLNTDDVVAGAAHFKGGLEDELGCLLSSPVNNLMSPDVTGSSRKRSMDYLYGAYSPVKNGLQQKKQPFSSPQHKLAVPSPPKDKQAALARAGGKLVAGGLEDSELASAGKLTISTQLINNPASSLDSVKSRDEDDLKWLMSITSRLPDGSPTAVSDFVWGDGFGVHDDVVDEDPSSMLFSMTPASKELSKHVKSKPCSNNKISINAGAAAATQDDKLKGHVLKVDPSRDMASELDKDEAASIEEWISSAEKNSADPTIPEQSDMLSVEAASDCGDELEHQPELAEMGPFTKYVFGDQDVVEANLNSIVVVEPPAKRVKIAA